MNTYHPQSRPHPGEILTEKLLEMDMGPKEFAIRTGKPEKTISAILNELSSITPEMAVQFENVTKIPAKFWLTHQAAFDEYKARLKQQETISATCEWAVLFPLAAMVKFGWLPQVKSKEEKAHALLAYFEMSNHQSWEQYYCKQQLKADFRISLAHTNKPFAISAWLRQGEIEASKLEAPIFSKKAFKEILPSIKTIMAEHPEDFFKQLQDLCLTAGVKVVFTQNLPKAPINGATRWLKDTPLIQLSGRYKRNDGFWFTFFHEAGHILLHGKKDIFLEKIEYSEKDLIKEKEADDFAIRWTFSNEQEEEMMKAAPFTDMEIRRFAKKFNTHPALIIGRLQHKNLIPYSLGREYFEKIIFE